MNLVAKKGEHLTTVLEAISQPVRREILKQLRNGEKPAASLAARFQVSFPAVSQHLAILKHAGLVSERRAGRQRIYQLRAKPLKEVYDWIGAYEQFWSNKLDQLGKFLRNKHGQDRT